MTHQAIRAEAATKLREATEAYNLGTDEGDATGAALQAEAAKLEARADNLKAIEERSAKLNVADPRRPTDAPAAKAEEGSEDGEGETRSAQDKAFRNFVYMRANYAERDILKTTVAGKAGNLIPKTYSDNIIEIAQKVGPMVNPAVVDHFTTESGADFITPRGDDRSGTAYVVVEGDDAGDTDVSFDTVTFKAIQYSTGFVQVTNPMLQDDGYDLMGYVQRTFGNRLGKLQNEHYTNGNGVTVPQGFVTGLTAANAVVESASSNSIAFADLLDAEDGLDEAYLEDAVWMMNRGELTKLRKIAASTGTPDVFQTNYSAGAPVTILGRKYIINNAMADNVIALAHFKELYGVRTVKGLAIDIANELFIRKNAKGLIGWARSDGRVKNPVAGILLRKKA